MNKTNFSDWLQDELRKRRWSQSDLANIAMVNRASISHIINRSRLPGPELLIAIAKALNLSPEFVFRKAGLLPERPEMNNARQQKIEQLLYLIERMSPEDQAEFIEMMETLASYKLSKGGENES